MSVCLYKGESDVNCLSFHPKHDLVVSGGVDGRIEVLRFQGFSTGLVKESANVTTHSSSVRISKFSPNGREIMSASSDRTVAITDVRSNSLKWVGKGHKNPVNSACYMGDTVVTTGDDEGEIRVWDTRTKGKSVARINEFEECVTDLLVGTGNHEMLATSGDQIACFDFRKLKLKAMSDNTEHEFLTMAVVKDGKKVVCGTATGSVCFFSYGFWGDLNDIISVNKDTVNSIVKISEDFICTCGDDGEIHLVQLFPNKVMGRLEEFKTLGTRVKSTDSLTINNNKSLLGFVSFDQIYLVGTDEVNRLMSEDQPDFFDDI